MGLSLALALCAALAPPAARADERDAPTGPGSEYARVIAQAVEEFRLQHWQEAIVLFARAHRLSPSARTHRGLGLASFEARQYGRALNHLRAALSERRRPLTEAQRAEVRAAIDRTLTLVGELHLHAQPAESALIIDGARRPWNGELIVLIAGEHTIELHARGHEPARRVVEVTAGERLSLTLSLTPRTQELGVASGAEAGLRTDAPSDPGAWPWVVMAASAGAAVGGGLLFAQARSDIAEVKDTPRGTRWEEVEQTHDGTALKSGLGLALLGVGVAGAATGLVWALSSSDDDDSAALDVSAAPGALHFRGRF
ncbi:MAG: PEGA domain-containing protein [Myxococcales bacterium]|nr:PEGA domain-containing protein [Myxococcales bacterium]